MENLLDKREKLKEKQKELQEAKMQAKDLKTKMMTKDAQADIDELKTEFTSLEERVKALEDEVLGLDNEITEEEKSLEAVSSGMKTKNVYISTGGKKVDYLKSKESVKDFAEIVAKGLDGTETRELWEKNLKKKGITEGESILLPQAIVTSIESIQDDNKEIVDSLNPSGLDVLKAGFDTNYHYGKEHTKGETKEEEELRLEDKEIRPGVVYEYITIDKETIREQKNTGALINYIMKELPKGIYRTIAANATGGYNSTSLDNLQKFESIVEANALYKEEITATDNLYEDIINLNSKIRYSGDRYLVISRSNLTKLKLTKDGGGHYLFAPLDDLSSLLGFKKIFTPDYMEGDKDGNNDSNIKAIAYVGSAYETVGDNTLETYENFLLSKNKQEYLMETYSGGALTKYKSAAVLKEVKA